MTRLEPKAWWKRESPTWLLVVVVALGVALLGLAILLSSGCHASKPPPCPIPPPVEVVKVRVDCLSAPPPVAPPTGIWEACAGHGACVSEDNARALILYLAKIQRYAVTAWAGCGPQPKEP